MALGSVNSRTINAVTINSSPSTTVDLSICNGAFNANPFNHIAVNDCVLTFYVGVPSQTVCMVSQSTVIGEVTGQIIEFSQDVQFQVNIEGQVILIEQDISTDVSGQVVQFSEYVISPAPGGNQYSGYGGQGAYGG